MPLPVDTYRHLATLASIVEAGNFTRAADRLGINRAAVSKRVQQMEAALGAPVFSRNTRRVELTPAGRVLLDHYLEASATLAAGVDEARETMSVVRGQVSVSCASALAVHVVAPALLAFATQQPDIKINLKTLGDAADRENVDIQLRVTHAPPEDQAVRALARVTWVMCASPAYLAVHGRPQTPADLAHHRFVMPPSYDRTALFRHRRSGKEIPVRAVVPLTTGIQEVIFSLVQSGAAIGLLPYFLTALPEAGRTLVPLLEDWELVGRPAETLYAIHAPAKLLRASTRAVLSLLADVMKPLSAPPVRGSRSSQ